MIYRSLILVLTSVFMAPNVSLAGPWVDEFAVDRFGSNRPDYSYREYYANERDFGRAAIEIESMLDKRISSSSNYSWAIYFLRQRQDLAFAVFRSTERVGIKYYGCVFGSSRAKELLKTRLDEYGHVLPAEIRDERVILVEGISSSPDDKINTTQDCSEFRKAYTSIWSSEVDAIYAANEAAIKEAQIKQEERRRAEQFVAAQRQEREKREQSEIKIQSNIIRNKLNPYGIAISKPSAFSYSSATGLRFSVLNLSNKPIKYVDLTLVGINAVGDAVIDRLKGRQLSFRAIGPIERDELASYSENVMWFTTVVQNVRVESIKITYMDGGRLNLKDPKKSLISMEELDLLMRSK